MKTAPRVVIDTNLLVSALIFGGAPGKLRNKWQAGDCIPLISKVTVKELMRVLTYPKFRLNAAEQEELLADYLPFCETVEIPNPPPPTPLCRDPFDVPFLVLALVGQADYLITGDKDLLELEEPFPCPIVALE
jgi:putative PIN family toxin of toxin-antitoxin system